MVPARPAAAWARQSSAAGGRGKPARDRRDPLGAAPPSSRSRRGSERRHAALGRRSATMFARACLARSMFTGSMFAFGMTSRERVPASAHDGEPRQLLRFRRRSGAVHDVHGEHRLAAGPRGLSPERRRCCDPGHPRPAASTTTTVTRFQDRGLETGASIRGIVCRSASRWPRSGPFMRCGQGKNDRSCRRGPVRPMA